jgi:hypothetical protein
MTGAITLSPLPAGSKFPIAINIAYITNETIVANNVKAI